MRTNDDHVPNEWRPLALDAQEDLFCPEDQVVSASLDHWAVDIDARLDARLRDRSLDNRALLICRQFEQHVEASENLGRAMPRRDEAQAPTASSVSWGTSPQRSSRR